jgi:hypothetical protein
VVPAQPDRSVGRLQRLALDDLSPQRASIVAIGLSVAGMGLVTPLL